MSSLKKQFVSAVLFTAISKYIGLIVQLVITGILARLLTPDDFGVVAIAMVFITFFNLLTDFGIGAAVIQNKLLNKEEIANIFSFTFYFGAMLAIVFFILASIIAAVYNRPVLENICRLLSLLIFFVSINIVPNSLLVQAKKFQFIAIRTFIIRIAVGFVGIGAAFLGAGVYSLIIYSVLTAIVEFTVNYSLHPLRLSFKIEIASLRKIYKYSIYQFFFNFVTYFSRNLDTLFIGKFLSTSTLGYYDKAYRLMLLPLENLTYVLSPIIHPFFSDFANDEKKIFDGYKKIAFFLAIIGFPLSVFMHFAASEIIYIVFGGQWEPAVPVFKILSWSVGLQIVLSSSGAIFQAANNTRMLFISGLISCVTVVMGICYGVFITHSTLGVAYGVTISYAVNFFITYFLLMRILNSSLWNFFSIFFKPFLLFVLVLSIELSYIHFVKIDGVFLNFMLKGIAGMLAVCLGVLLSGDFSTICKQIKSLLQRRGIPSVPD